MQPMLIDAVQDGKSGVRWNNAPQPLRQVVTAQVAREMREAMVAVVHRGTGQQAALAEIEVAGKTGSAENPQGPAHAWFVGMAPSLQPEICLAVIVENSGSGGSVAAPLAREIFWAYFSGKRAAPNR